MSERFSRSKVNLATDNRAKVRPASPIPHQVPQFVGAMRGVDPRAGDMTAAFSNFFGTINSVVQQTANTFGKIEAQKITDRNQEFKRLARFNAQDLYMADPDNAMAKRPTSVVIDGESFDVSESQSYNRTFSSTIGALSGQKLMSDFQIALLEDQVQPNEYAAYRDKYWQDQYSGGTGNAFHDEALANAWYTNIGEFNFKNDQEIFKQARERSIEAAGKVIHGYGQNARSITQDNYLDSVALLKQIDRSLTPGQAASGVLGQWLHAAKTNETASNRLAAFIVQPYVDEDGKNKPSLYDRFPREMDTHLQALHDSRLKYTTGQGAKAATNVATSIAAAKSIDVSTAKGLQDQGIAYAQLMTSIASLDDIPGVSRAKIAGLKADLNKERIAHRTQVINLNAAGAIAQGRRPKISLTTEELNDQMPRLISTFDFLSTGNPKDAQRFGVAMKNIQTQRNILPKAAMTYLAAGINDNDPKNRAMAFAAISAIDPTHSGVFSEHIKDNGRALINYSNLRTGKNSQQLNSDDPGLQAAFKTNKDDLSIILNLGTLPTTKREDTDKANIEGVLYGDSGSGITTLAEDLSGKFYFPFFEKEPELSPLLKRRVIDIAGELVARHKADTGRLLSEEALRDQIVNTLKGQVITRPNGMVDFASQSPVLNNDGTVIPAFNNRQFNPAGIVENTVENVQEAIEDIRNGLVGVSGTGGEELGNLSLRNDAKVAHLNGMMVYDESTQDLVTLKVGQKLQTERIYSGTGERFSGFRDYLPEFMAEGYENKEIVLTGDPKKDKELASMFLHPSIALYPVQNAQQDKVTGYQLVVVPYFKDMPRNWIADEEYKNRVAENKPFVPERRKFTKAQLRFGRYRAEQMYQRRMQREAENRSGLAPMSFTDGDD